ncbi:MAG: 16S rRNA (guanine(966)-N(2))-methyltransferase RsmD [Gammaproteobacteria bacterium]|nr:16S rRNA (guanine(966)-N(2))-methyltransferase RsmD [Gammaproteobacteria bacterium]MBP9728939.1 16S rRNA (guanine(966)-N(2))-methyltransferase RsmD [Gammaproteobacteria bacterium]
MQPSEIRIIGGIWRSRKIRFPKIPARPTPDRVRETLFNWLEPVIKNACCVDLFAGTGALSFEALSRGASKAICIERDRLSIETLEENKQSLQAHGMQILHMDAMRWLALQQASIEKSENAVPFDIVFVDPPYPAGLLPSCFIALESFIKPKTLIYFEHNAPITPSELPQSWELLRQKKAGQVYYHLVQKSPG